MVSAYPQPTLRGDKMTDNELALLKSLVLRPSQLASSMMQAIIVPLHEQGYVTPRPSGWLATEKGCLAVEQMRRSAGAVEFGTRVRNR